MGIEPLENRTGDRDAVRRQEIIAAATELFVTEGYERTSMRNIAGRLNVTATTLYLYFQNKEQLLAEMVRVEFGQFLADLSAVGDRDLEAEAGLTAILEACIRFGLSHPEHYRVLFGVLNARPARASGSASPEEQVIDRIAQVLDGLALPTDSIDDIARILWASVHGLVMSLLSQPSDDPSKVDHLIARTIALLVQGTMGRRVLV